MMFIKSLILTSLFEAIFAFVQVEIYRVNYRPEGNPLLGSDFIGSQLPSLIALVFAAVLSPLLIKKVITISQEAKTALYASLWLIVANYHHYWDILYKLTQGKFEWYDAIPTVFELILFYLISFLVLRIKGKR